MITTLGVLFPFIFTIVPIFSFSFTHFHNRWSLEITFLLKVYWIFQS